MRPTVLAYLLGVGTPLLLAGALALSGLYDMSADHPPSALERAAGQLLSGRSVGRRAGLARNPLPATPEVLRSGLDAYRRDCLTCHGAPGVAAPMAQSLNPPAPDLARAETQRASDAQLYQVIAHGIRMTAMPAWAPSRSDRQLWELVAAVRHLPSLAPAELAVMRDAPPP